MKRRTIVEILTAAFKSLTKRQKANLRYHRLKKTRVLCSGNTYLRRGVG